MKGPANTAIHPVPRDDAWLERHAAFVARARSGDIDLLFVGDSLTDWWADPEKGLPVWQEYFSHRKAANFGISADRTQHLLWRLSQGEGAGFEPKAIVLLIGTNNTGLEKDGSAWRNTAEEALEGIQAVVLDLKNRFPQASIVHFALFPRGEKDSEHRRQIVWINRALASRPDDQVVFADIGSILTDAQGEIIADLLPDGVHLSTKGYRLWAGVITSILELLPHPRESSTEQRRSTACIRHNDNGQNKRPISRK